MGRGSSKNKLILEESGKRVAQAKETMDAMDMEFRVAKASYFAHAAAHEALEQSLAPVARRPKSVQPAKQKSKTAATTETSKGIVSTATKCAVPNCGLTEKAEVHLNDDCPGYHLFHSEIKKKRIKKEELPPLPDNPEEFQHGAVA